MNNDFMSQIESLRSTLGKMEVALGSISEAIVWTDAAGQIQWCNAALDRFIGKPHIALLGTPAVDLMPLKERGVSIPGKAYPVSLILKQKTERSGYCEFMRGERIILLEIMGRYMGRYAEEPFSGRLLKLANSIEGIIARLSGRGQNKGGQNVRFYQQFGRNCFGRYKNGDERRGRRSHFLGRKKQTGCGASHIRPQ